MAKTTAAREALRVCEQCGWYVHGPYMETQCDPKLGKVADELAAQAARAGVEATKLGYGFGMLTFLIDERTSMTVQVHRDGTYDVRTIHMLDDTYPSDVMLLVESLKAIRLRAKADKRAR